MTIDLHDIIANTKDSGVDDLDIDSDNLKLQKQKLENNRYHSDTSDRKWLAIWTAVVVSLWLSAVMGVLVYNNQFFCLSDEVLIALLGTTTLNVLGLSFIVLRGHFQTTLTPKK